MAFVFHTCESLMLTNCSLLSQSHFVKAIHLHCTCHNFRIIKSSSPLVDNNRRTLGLERIISISVVIFQPNETISLLPQFQNSLETAFRSCSTRKEFMSFLSQTIHRVQWPWAFMFSGYDSKSSQVRRSRGKGVEAHLREFTRTPEGNQNFGP